MEIVRLDRYDTAILRALQRDASGVRRAQIG
jgi:DNA-binding Lrp family transcriptional regulator